MPWLRYDAPPLVPTLWLQRSEMATMSDEKKSMTELEGWIEQLMECKQLSENQVQVMKTWGVMTWK